MMMNSALGQMSGTTGIGKIRLGIREKMIQVIFWMMNFDI